nr:hypothetical protein [Pandoravirus massiliensis]
MPSAGRPLSLPAQEKKARDSDAARLSPPLLPVPHLFFFLYFACDSHRSLNRSDTIFGIPRSDKCTPTLAHTHIHPRKQCASFCVAGPTLVIAPPKRRAQSEKPR